MAGQGEIGVAIVGLGFMGRTHLRSYGTANRAGFPNRLVAIADRHPERVLSGEIAKGNIETVTEGPLFDPEEVRVVGDPAEVFALPGVDVVSICTPTDSHVPLAKAALDAGKHVLLEKPVALTAAEVAELAAHAKASGKVCMPAMCMRFWPGWDWLAETVHKGTYGKVHSAVFRRLGTRPDWSPEFYGNAELSGGALFDLHVHDADFIQHAFGVPQAVTSAGTLDHLTTAYHYDGDGPAHVVAEGAWDHTPGFPFHMGFTVIFEHATAEYAFGRPDPLLVAQAGSAQAVALTEETGYDGEVRHFLAAVRGELTPRVNLDEAVNLVATLEAERSSLAQGERVRPGFPV